MEAAPAAWPWQKARLQLSLLAFLAYVWVMITYTLNIGEIAIATALFALPLSSRRIVLPAPLLFFAAYFLWCLLGYAVSPYRSIIQEPMLTTGKIWLITFVAVNLLHYNRAHLRLYVFVYLGAFALYPMRGGLFNYFVYHSTEFGRAAWNHIFSNPNDLAAYALLPMGLCVGILYTEQNKYLRLAAKIGCVLLPLLMFVTQSRGALLGLFLFGLCAFAGHRRRFRMLLGAGVIAVVLIMFAPSDVWERLGNLSKTADTENLGAVQDLGSAEQRYEIWKVARAIAADNPLTGVGIGAYRYAHQRMARAGRFKLTARGQRDTHSTYLNVLAETGGIGLCLFLAIFVSVLVRAELVRRRLKQVRPDTERQIFFVEIALLSFLLSAIFGTYAHVPLGYLHVATLFAMTQQGQNQLDAASGGLKRRF